MTVPWRTETVVALCRLMLDSRDWTALPVLADALEEAGCDDAALVAACRDPSPSPVFAERAVNLAYSEETAEAVRWLEDFAGRLGQTCENWGEGWEETRSAMEAYRLAHGTLEGFDWQAHRAVERWTPITYADVIQAGHGFVDHGDYFVQIGSEEARDLLYDDEVRRTFWRHWCLVTGRNVSLEEDDIGSAPFSCSC